MPTQILFLLLLLFIFFYKYYYYYYYHDNHCYCYHYINVMTIVNIMIDLCFTMSRGETQSLLTYSTYDSAMLFPIPFVGFISNAVFLYSSVGRVLWGHSWVWQFFPPSCSADTITFPTLSPNPLHPPRCRPQYYFLGIEGIKIVFTWSSANIHLGIVLGQRRPG